MKDDLASMIHFNMLMEIDTGALHPHTFYIFQSHYHLHCLEQIKISSVQALSKKKHVQIKHQGN